MADEAMPLPFPYMRPMAANYLSSAGPATHLHVLTLSVPREMHKHQLMIKMAKFHSTIKLELVGGNRRRTLRILHEVTRKKNIGKVQDRNDRTSSKMQQASTNPSGICQLPAHDTRTKVCRVNWIR